MYILKNIFALGLLVFVSCADTNDLYYSAAEANSRIIVAFAIKDANCNYTHRITAPLPGEARKTEVDACVQAIIVKLCAEWLVSDPNPIICKTINYRTNYRLRAPKCKTKGYFINCD